MTADLALHCPTLWSCRISRKQETNQSELRKKILLPSYRNNLKNPMLRLKDSFVTSVVRLILQEVVWRLTRSLSKGMLLCHWKKVLLFFICEPLLQGKTFQVWIQALLGSWTWFTIRIHSDQSKAYWQILYNWHTIPFTDK